MTDARQSARSDKTDRSDKSGKSGKSTRTSKPATPGKSDGAAVRGVAIWLAIASVVVIGIVLAVRHGAKVTALLGYTT